MAAHSSPVYLEVRDRPLDAREDAEFWLAWIDRLDADLKKRDRIPAGLDHVEMQLETARGVYRRLISEAARRKR